MTNSTPDDASSGLHELRTAMSFERNGEKINVQVGDFVEVFAGDSLPYIARVATIGKDDEGEIVAKMQWFYRQTEIPPNMKKRLGRKLEKNEVFLSTHLDFNAVESVLNSVKIQFVDNEGRSFVSRGEGDQMGGPKYVCSCDYSVAEDKISPLSAEKVRWLRKAHNISESKGDGEAAASASQKGVTPRTSDKRDHNTQTKDNKEHAKVDSEKASKPKLEEPKNKTSQNEISNETKATKAKEKTESNTDATSSPQAKRQRFADNKSVSSQGSGAAVKQKKKQSKADDQSKKKSRIVVSSSSSGESGESSDEESTAAEDDDDLNSVATVRSASDFADGQKSNAAKRETVPESKKKVNEKDNMKQKNDKVSLDKPKGAPSKTISLSEMEKKKQEAVSAALAGIQKSLSDNSSKPVQGKTGEITTKSVKSVIAAEEKRKEADAQTKKTEQPSLPSKFPESQPQKAEPLQRTAGSSEGKAKTDAIEPKAEGGKPAKPKSVIISNQPTRTEQDNMSSLKPAVSESQSNPGAKSNEKEDKATTNLVKPASDGGVAPVRPKTPLSDTSLSTDGDEFGLLKNVTPSKSRVDSAKKRMSEARKSIRAPDTYLRPSTDDEAAFRALTPEPSAIEQNFAGLAMSKEGRKSPTPPPERLRSSRRRRGRDRSLDPEDDLDNARLHLRPQGAVRIGTQYQAALPPFLGSKPSQPTCNAQLVSKPGSASSMPAPSIADRCSRRGSILALALSEPSSPVEEERKRVLWVRVCEPANSEGNVRVCPFDACWPKVQGKPESFVVPKSTMMMMAPSKSFIQSDAFPGSLSSSPGDTIATWSEQEYIAYCEALKKIRPNSQITTLLATAVKTKTPTEVVEMFWIPRRGIGSAPHIIVTCSKCKAARVPLVSCKSYFICRSVVCEKCFKDMHGKLVESDRESDVLSLFQRAKYGHWFCKVCVKRPASTAEALPSKAETSISISSVLPSTNKPSSDNAETNTGSTMAISAVIGGKQQSAGATSKAEATSSNVPSITKSVAQGKPVASSVVSNAKKQGGNSNAAQPVKPQGAASAAIPATTPALSSAQVSVNDDSKTRALLSIVDTKTPAAQVSTVTESKPPFQVLTKAEPSAQTTMSLQVAEELEEADTIAGVIQLHDAGKVSPEDAIERIRAILVTEAKKNLELAMLLAKSKGK